MPRGRLCLSQSFRFQNLNSSDSEQEEMVIPVPRYIPPHKRRLSGTPDHSTVSNVSRRTLTYSCFQGHNEDSNISNITRNSSDHLHRSFFSRSPE